MEISVIKQAITKECLFNVITKWCQLGAGKNDHSIFLLSAFVSGAGVAALSPLFDIFLSHGNHIEIICGVDRGGTDADAIKRLFSLQHAHHASFTVNIFNAPSGSAIFHPKLYIYNKGNLIDFVIGSANMTGSGLGSNFESLILYQNVPKTQLEAMHAFSIWNTYANPQKPLSPSFLRPLTSMECSKQLSKLPKKSNLEKRSTKMEVATLWRPHSRIQLPYSSFVYHRRPIKQTILYGSYLLMDILAETRKTQMQIPLSVIQNFFKLDRRERADVNLSIWSSDGITQPIHRPIVISEGPDRVRLMRRIEIPEIRMRKRNLAILFLKLKGRRRFVYCIIPRESKTYKTANNLLQYYGQQGGKVRRYYIGTKGDVLWKKIRSLLPR